MIYFLLTTLFPFDICFNDHFSFQSVCSWKKTHVFKKNVKYTYIYNVEFLNISYIYVYFYQNWDCTEVSNGCFEL